VRQAVVRSALVQRLSQSVRGIKIEQRLDPRCYVIRQINERAPARDREQHHGGTLLHGQFHHLDGIVDQIDRPAEIETTDDCEASLERSAQEGRAQGDQDSDAEIRAALAASNDRS
jgi:hypothetical protein